VCRIYKCVHDVTLRAPFKTVQQGNLIPFTATVPTSDGTSAAGRSTSRRTNVTTASGSTTHTFTTQGTYIVAGYAKIGTAVHDNINRSSSSRSPPPTLPPPLETPPASRAAFWATRAGRPPVRPLVLQAGGNRDRHWIVHRRADQPALHPWVATIKVAPGGTGTPANTTSSATETVAFASAGTYWVTFVGVANGPNGALAYQNYTWTVFVARPASTPARRPVQRSRARTRVSSSLRVLPGRDRSRKTRRSTMRRSATNRSSTSNQTLVAYNGSQTGPTWTSYVPQIRRACGEPGLQALYGGSTLITATTTRSSSGVTLSSTTRHPEELGRSGPDVMFRVVRTMGFSTSPCFGCNTAGSRAGLLSPGNGSWDGLTGSSTTRRSTMYNSMVLNGSDCPAAAMTNAHGLHHFNAAASGHPCLTSWS